MTSTHTNGSAVNGANVRKLLSGLASCEPLIQLHEKHPESSAQFYELAKCIRQDASKQKEAQPNGDVPGKTKEKAAGERPGEDTPTSVADKAFTHFEESVSFNSPRGRFNIAFSENSMFLTKTPSGKATGNSEEAMPVLTLKRSNVRHIFKMDIKDQYQTEIQWLFAIILKEPITYGKGKYASVTFLCSESKAKYAMKIIREVDSKGLNPKADGLTIECQGEGLKKVTELPWTKDSLVIKAPSLLTLMSCVLKNVHEVDSEGSSGESCIKCYHKVSNGRLWLLNQGALFGPRPLIFLPREKIGSMQIGRQSSQANTFDLIFTDKEGKKTEFQMIEDAYSDTVKDYIRQNYEAPEEEKSSGDEATSAEEETGDEVQEQQHDAESEDEDDFDENDGASEDSSSNSDTEEDDDEEDDSDASADSADLDISNAAKESMRADDKNVPGSRSLRTRLVELPSNGDAAKDAIPSKENEERSTSATRATENEEENEDKGSDEGTETESEGESSLEEQQKHSRASSGVSEGTKRPHSTISSSGASLQKAQKVQSSVSSWFVE